MRSRSERLPGETRRPTFWEAGPMREEGKWEKRQRVGRGCPRPVAPQAGPSQAQSSLPSSRGPSAPMETLSPSESNTSITAAQDVDCPVTGARTGPLVPGFTGSRQVWADEVGLTDV